MSTQKFGSTLGLLMMAAMACAPAQAAKGGAKPPVVTPIKARNVAEALLALQKTPDGALKAFLAALIGGDEAAIRQVMMPVSDADFAVLTNEKPPAPKVRDALVARIAGMPVRALRVGETVPLPGGKSLTVDKGDIGDDHVLLQMPNGPLPYLVLRVKGLWYVDASSIIAGRKTSIQLAQQKAKKAH